MVHRIRVIFMLIVIATACLIGMGWTLGSGVWGALVPGGSTRSEPAFGERNAIVLLSAGVDQWEPGAAFTPTYDASFRIEKTAAAYAACKAEHRICKVIVSGGDPENHGVSDAEVYKPLLEKLGVSDADLILEQRSGTTYENAKYVRPLLRDGRYSTVVLVTSEYHMRRAELAFELFGFDVLADAARADRPVMSWLPRKRNIRLALRALHEVGGMVQLRLYDWTGFH